MIPPKISMETVFRNQNFYSDILSSYKDFDNGKRSDIIKRLLKIATTYHSYLKKTKVTTTRTDVNKREWIQIEHMDIYRLLRRLYEANEKPNMAFQAALISYHLLKRYEFSYPTFLHFDEREDYIYFLIRQKRFDLVSNVLQEITPEMFNCEGYQRAEVFFNNLSIVEELKKNASESLQKFRFLLGKTVPKELSMGKYLLYLLKTRLFQFFNDMIKMMTDEELNSLPKYGADSLPAIVREYDRNFRDYSYEDLKNNNFYVRTDKILVESCPIAELRKCRAICKSYHRKWRKKDFDNMIRFRHFG